MTKPAEPVIDKVDGRSLRSGFLASAAAHPQATALAVQGVTRTYGELETTARIWAQAIGEALGRRPERVGIFGYRSEVSYAGVLAALFGGATFVPLNRTFPPARTRRMIEAANLDAIIVDQSSSVQLTEILKGLRPTPLLLLPENEAREFSAPGRVVLGKSELAGVSPLAALPPVIPSDIAYLLFTSGSTGVPKGVPVTHGNVLHFIDVITDRYGITPADRFSQTFDQTFDLSVFDLFVAWERGASVYAMQPLELLAPTRFVTRNELTVWFSVPSIPALMRKKGFLKPGGFPSLRLSLFCGEPLPVASAEAWQQAAPNSILENLYGPTELTIACLLHRWDPERSPALCVNGMVPIGRPFPGLGAMLLDDDLRPITDGGAGELCVCGPQTVPGYWQDDAKTAERFVSVRVSPSITVRVYRTGDRAARHPSGDYVYLGRVDHQIKVLGHRVELGEIEAALRADAAVVEAIAVGWPVEEGTAHGIVAFVSGSGIDQGRLLEAVRAKLPDYMTPREIRVIDTMPLNPNGKIDRNALQQRLDGTR
ncbi:MAG TPA: amino acid adenylation domain-containing protein [Gemmatimonadales bacterium]|nr:amino acid adenylation domain-containing protein [Gemmatimonadales bacterium]